MLVPSNFTPVKVRGKRRGYSAEKWNTGRRRKADLQKRPETELVTSTTLSQASSRPRKRRRRESESPLEALPAEILQQIFEHAANIELPTVSRQLALKLSKSQHLHHELTTRLLKPVLDISDGDAHLADRAAATRLLNSRFMTFDFFKSWLRSQPNVAALLTNSPKDSGDLNWQRLWLALQPSPHLLPPKKVISPPFTQQKASFLSIFAPGINNLSAIDASYGELAQETLMAAVGQGNGLFVALFLKMGLKTSTELLRIAVADAGCEKDIVQMLVKGPASVHFAVSSLSSDTGSEAEVDLLDPILWSWAEKQHDEKGEWLVAFLKEEQRLKEQSRALDTPLQQ